MYIAQVYKVSYDFWRYLIGASIVVFGFFLFSMPHLIAITLKMMDGSVDETRMDDPAYLLGLFEPNLNLVFVLIPFAGALLCLVLAVKFLHKQSLTMLTTSRPRIDWGRIWFAFFFWAVVSMGLIFMDYFLKPGEYVFNFKPIPFLILAIIAIILVPLQTSFEEYFFRGYLMQGIGTLAKNRWAPLIITSVGFGLLHIFNPEVDKLGYVIMVYYISTGFFLGILTLMDEGLELALGFHAANNLFTALLVTADWTAFQTHSVFKDMSDPTEMTILEILIPVFVIFPILLLVFSVKYKWTGWKDKLFGPVVQPTAAHSNDPIDQIGEPFE